MAVFFESTGAGDLFYSPWIALPIRPVDWFHTSNGSQAAVIVALSYQVSGASIGNLTRTVTYGDRTMTSLGVVGWNNGIGSFTELFALMNPPKGKQRVLATVNGMLLAGGVIRGTSVSYTGVDSIGSATTAYGSGTSLSMSSSAPTADKLVQAYGTQSGLTAYNRSQRYLSNSSIGLLVGDVDGTGSSTSFTATRATSGNWSGVVVGLAAADIVGSVKPVVVDVQVSATGQRLPRPGIPRRKVFAA